MLEPFLEILNDASLRWFGTVPDLYAISLDRHYRDFYKIDFVWIDNYYLNIERSF